MGKLNYIKPENLSGYIPKELNNLVQTIKKKNFIVMVFDAVVGNNDRHFYNWGIVMNTKNGEKPYFSPIFDTARGLFWNDSEQRITNALNRKGQLEFHLKKYIKNSLYKIKSIMVAHLINNLLKSDEQEIGLSTPIDTIAQFELHYKTLVIGHLVFNKGVWSFSYSEKFKNQSEINSIVSFPDKNKIYQSHTLFPFFAFRIPSLKRLKIQNIVPKNITTDEVVLLKMFGKNSIANPYKLIFSKS